MTSSSQPHMLPDMIFWNLLCAFILVTIEAACCRLVECAKLECNSQDIDCMIECNGFSVDGYLYLSCVHRELDFT